MCAWPLLLHLESVKTFTREEIVRDQKRLGNTGIDTKLLIRFSSILGILQKFNFVEKLLVQTHDGAPVILSELNGVQAGIKKDVPEAKYLHCYAHKLTLVLLHSAKCMPDYKAFFKTREDLSAFFSKSTNRTHFLDNVMKRRLPKALPTRWSSNSGLLQTVSMYHFDLLTVFRVIGGDADGKWDNDSVMKAGSWI